MDGIAAAALPAATWTPVTVDGRAGLPSSGIEAVQVTFTAVTPAQSGWLNAAAGDASSPSTAVTYLNWATAGTSNTAVIPVGANGKIQVRVSSSINLVIDVQGYYTSGSTAAGGYVPVAATQLASTGSGTGGLPAAKIATGATVSVPVAGVGPVPASASAVMLSISEGNPSSTAAGYLYAYPEGASKSGSLNWTAGHNTEWTAAVAVGTNSGISVTVGNGGPINLVITVQGYLTATSGGSAQFTAAQTRVYDSRSTKAIPAGATRTVPVGGYDGVPEKADGLASVAVDITIIPSAGANGHLQAFPDNATSGQSVAQFYDSGNESTFTTVKVGVDGGVDLQNSSPDPINVIVDVEGWYTGITAGECAADTVTLMHTQSVGADDGNPVVSTVAVSSLGSQITGNVYVTDSAGNPVDGRPIATGEIDSGTPITFHIPSDELTAGDRYTWWITASVADVCAPSASTAHTAFTEGAPAAATAPTGSETATITGSALNVASAPVDTTALGAGTLAVGGDNGTQWDASLKADLSSIPANSVIDSATLQLTSAGCAVSTDCDGANLLIAEADTDVTAAGTGADLDTIDTGVSDEFTETATGTSDYDLTELVQDWYANSGGSNFGAVLTGADQGDNDGIAYASPTAAANPAELIINYSPATAPTAVQDITATAGDGGVLLTWADPANPGDTDGSASDLSYTITILDSTGATVANRTSDSESAVVTGLTDGDNYSAAVTASNSIGNSATTITSVFSPAAVPGGPSLYIAAVTQLLNDADQLQEGTVGSAIDAVADDSQKNAVTAALADAAAGDVSVYNDETANGQADINDGTTLADSLAVLADDGSTVILYTTANEEYTTVDTSSGTEDDVAGGETDAIAVGLGASASTPAVLWQAEEAALSTPLTMDTADSVYRADESSDSNDTSVYPRTGTSATVESAIAVHMSSSTKKVRVSRSKVATWADNETDSKAKRAKLDKSMNGFKGPDDCTDFVSNALHTAGLAEAGSNPLPGHHDEPSHWYRTNILGHLYSWSNTWSVAPDNARYLTNHGGSFDARGSTSGGASVTRTAVRGDVVYVSWTGHSSFTASIGHAAIVSTVSGSNAYVDQATNARYREPIWKAGNSQTWSKNHKNIYIWVVNPSYVKN